MLMKRILTTIFFASLAFQVIGQSGLNNLGFENWGTNSLGEPQPSGYASLGANENTSDPTEGSSALKLEVYYNAFLDDTIAASTLGQFSGGNSIDLGAPYTNCPDSITGSVRFSLQNQDTAAIMAEVWSGPDTMATADTLFGGSQGSWTPFTITFDPIDCNGMTPDSIVIYMTAESVGLGQYVPDFQDRGTQTIGSTFELDGLVLHDSTNTSIMDLASKEGEYAVRPNPAQERVRFEFGSMAHRVQVFDMTGRKVRTAQVGQSSFHNMDVSGMDEGLYIYRVQDRRGRELHSDKLQVIH